MMCDIIVAADTARFGQPDIKLGVMPGMGASQRLSRAIWQAKSMEMCITGRKMDAAEAERCGLVLRVVPADQLLYEAMALAVTSSEMPLSAVMSIKDAVGRASDLPLQDGLRYEHRLFHALFATRDQRKVWPLSWKNTRQLLATNDPSPGPGKSRSRNAVERPA